MDKGEVKISLLSSTLECVFLLILDNEKSFLSLLFDYAVSFSRICLIQLRGGEREGKQILLHYRAEITANNSEVVGFSIMQGKKRRAKQKIADENSLTA